MHAKRSSSNNLHHRENADRDHQAETQKRSWQPKLTAQPLRSNCVHNLGGNRLPTASNNGLGTAGSCMTNSTFCSTPIRQSMKCGGQTFSAREDACGV